MNVTRLRLRFQSRVVVTLGAIIIALVTASRAHAGNSIWLSFCDAAPNHSVEGFAAVQDRGLLTRRDCREVGKTEEGLMTRTARDTVKGRRRFEVRYRDVAGLVFRAPPGTVIKSVQWGGDARRRSCDWLAQLRIIDENQPGVKNELLAGHSRGLDRCPDREPLHPARPKRIRTYNILGNPRYDVPRPKVLAQRVICVNRHGCPLAEKPQAYIVTQNLRIEIVDEQPPTQLTVTGGDVFGGWINSDRNLSFTASDSGSGVKTVRAVNDAGTEIGNLTRDCFFTRPVPCPNDPGSLNVQVRRAREGTQTVGVQALDAGGNATGLVPAGQMRVDTIAPGAAAVSVDGDTGWRNTPTFTLRWSNADNAGDVAPITGARYRICPLSTRCDATPGSSSSTDQLSIDAAPGESDIAVWRVDAASNENPANASVPVTLRFDPDPPTAVFEPLDPDDPTRLSAPVSDRYSGVAAGQIELSQQGSGVWQAVPTQLEGSRLVARIDDSRLPAGIYGARVVARDAAGNTTVSDQTAVGQPMLLQLPLRIESRLSGGVEHKAVKKRTVRRRGKRRVKRRRVTVHRPSVTAGLDRKIRIGGRLTNRDGHPIGGAQIHIYSRPQGGSEELVGVVRTAADGRYRYTLRADRNRTLRVAYPGTPLILPAERQVAIGVAATSSFRVSRREVPNGGAVLFSGRVRSLPVPSTGKIVELQWRVGGADWGTFQTVRTDPSGRWRLRYRFSRIRSTVQLRFRAWVPAEGGYPFVSGASRSTRITVTARE
ncbi:MAG: hypothetical protein QOD71_460 [Thermoleophilaceae bacterium]|jgi:hypothetical protein|nr:hypothetical protein [Thermoleophilaceae bacterium]